MFKITSSAKKSSITFYTEVAEFSGTVKIAQKVMEDVRRVTDGLPKLVSNNSIHKIEDAKNTLIFGTIGQNELIETAAEKLNLEQIRGKRECFTFTVIGTNLVIAGSDKRGTIYGLFHLSKLMGVSPLVDWADIPPAKKVSVIITEKDNYVSKEPSVRFRGFFINDEWPAFGNWCNKRFGGFNAKCYEHVFELLLRLKGNYLWPAMWASRFSDDGPGLENAELANELGVVMGASHHEPCCRAGEEYKYLRGSNSKYGDAWNFRTNEEGITKFWEDGLKRNGQYENVITVGMRGEADTAIMKNATLKDNISLLRDVLRTQNALIRQYVNKDLNKVPRMLALYKEVEPYFYGSKHTKGLMGDKELEGVTLMLCDDNHGNLRTVPNEKMREHNGGYGMYYHFDYHGWPFSYEWFNTTHLAKVKEQMSAAYDFGIRDLWIVNVGDVMTNEFPLSFFLDLAYDFEEYSNLDYSVLDYTKDWVDFQFAPLSIAAKKEIVEIIDGYTKLTHKRRTECVQPLTYHPVNYNESDETLNQALHIIELCEKLKKENQTKNKELWPGLYSQVYLPAIANMNVLCMQLYSGKNQWLANHNLIAAGVYAKKVMECIAKDKQIVDECDKACGGKWYAMGWSEHFGFQNWCEAANKYPVYYSVEPTRKNRFLIWIEGTNFTTTGQDWTIRDLLLDQFNNPDVNEVKVYIANSGKNKVDYDYYFENDNSFVTSSRQKFMLDGIKEDPMMDIITLKVDRKKLAQSKEKKNVLTIHGKDGRGGTLKVNIHIDAEFGADKKAFEKYPKGTFIQTQDYVSMEAAHYTAIADDSWKELKGYGKTLSAVKCYPVVKEYPKIKEAPAVEYNFVAKEKGQYSFDFYSNPSNPAYKDNKLAFAAEVNGRLQIIDCVSKDYAVGDNQFPWGSEVTNNIRITTATFKCEKGLNTLKVRPVSPGFVLEKIVIYKAGMVMPESYLGAPETYRV